MRGSVVAIGFVVLLTSANAGNEKLAARAEQPRHVQASCTISWEKLRRCRRAAQRARSGAVWRACSGLASGSCDDVDLRRDRR